MNYDAIVIGAGQAGVPLASALAKAGKKTLMIEREHIGGTCVNEGGPNYGIHSGASLTVDMERVRQRKRDIVVSFRTGNESRLKSAGVDCIMGEASFSDPKTVRIKMQDGSEGKSVTADLIFINTGERPAIPKLPGIESVPVLTSTSIMELDVVPEHLIVMGGGYIGMEFGQLFRRLGAAVTIVQRGKQLLPREDPDIAAEVLKIVKEDGITVLLETSPTEASKDEKGAIKLVVSRPNGTETITGSHLLAAAGRTANTDMLNLSAAGVSLGPRGTIPVSPSLETNVPGIYAMGDVKGGPAFTHISYDDFRIVQANVLDTPTFGNPTTTNRLVPYTVFMDPQLGHVGLHEREAREMGKKIKVATMPMTYVARALEVDETRGMMKAVVDAETDLILGYTILGLEGGEIMSIMQMAIMGGLKWMVLRDAVFAHPTIAEGLNNLWSSLK